eukprot:1248774-Rhodomonas_salina.1
MDERGGAGEDLHHLSSARRRAGPPHRCSLMPTRVRDSDMWAVKEWLAERGVCGGSRGGRGGGGAAREREEAAARGEQGAARKRG